MASDVQIIRDFVPGNALQIYRKIANPWKFDPVIEATLYVISWANLTLLEKTVRPNLSRIDPPPDDGLILNTGDKSPFVVVFKFNLFADETEKLAGNPNYVIKLSTVKDSREVEVGRFLPGDPGPGTKRKQLATTLDAPAATEINFVASEALGLFQELLDTTEPPSPPLPPPPPPAMPSPVPGEPGYVSDIAYTTYSDACETVGGREQLIIDGFMDAALGDYRQLRVHDEHARRTATNPLQLRLSYEYINKFTVPEIFDGNNNPINFSIVSFDFRDGLFSVMNDDGKQDYFVTYTFNFFPEKTLRMFVDQTVLEMNYIGAGAGSYATSYVKLEETPPSWDGVIALGATAKAWRKLATHVPLWRNFLIFEGERGEGVTAPGGQAAQQAASDAATYYQSMYDTYAAGTKWEKYVIGPTFIWEIFRSTGFGQFGPLGPQNMITQNSKFRGLTVNKSGVY